MGMPTTLTSISMPLAARARRAASDRGSSLHMLYNVLAVNATLITDKRLFHRCRLRHRLFADQATSPRRP